uniref:Uncharacterized protein n=2 Tax=Onchocerca TaxID=6281 RepID=A0A8R1TKU9_ONCVO
MGDDDSFNIATVPRHVIFGAHAGSGDDESTLGDKFFDFSHLQTNSAKKVDLVHHMSLHDRLKLVSSNPEQEFKQNSTITATAAITDAAKIAVGDRTNAPSENIHGDVPFELNRLAMFRPPSRTGRRSNTVPREENTVHVSTDTVKLIHGNLSVNGYVDREATNHTSKTDSSCSNQPAKTLRSSASHLLYPKQVVRRSLNRNRNHSAEIKQRIRPIANQPTTKIRAASAEPRTKKTTKDLLHTNGSLVKKTAKIDIWIQPHRLLRVRSTSLDTAATKNIAVKTENTVKTNQRISLQHGNGMNSIARNIVNAQRVASDSATTKKSPYMGPETRARAKMKQSNQNPKVVKISSTVNAPKRSIFMKPVRPLSQLNPNIPRNSVGNAISVSDNKSSHVSRPRTRIAHEPIRVRNTQKKVKGADGLPPIESESRFRQSLTRRPKGGDSLDRDVTKATEKQSGDEIWTVVTKKPDPVLEFAPCLRSRVAAKKMQSTSTTHFTRPSKIGQSKIGGGDASSVPHRRTEAEREAFFRRLSTPKAIAAVKKCTK